MFSGDKVVAVTGASGFLGRHLVASLHERPDVGLRVLVHRRQPSLAMDDDRIRTVPGDLLTPNGLDLLLAPDCTVIHLAYSGSSSGPENLKAASNLADACAKARIRRLVHCSTAVVAGRVGDDLINENTRCRPAPGYESTKFEMERIFAEKAAGRFELAILRPAAVFGPGGRNLLKMADDLKSGNRVMNYLKSCLFDQRPMNLVSVGHVVSALTFLAFAERKWNGDVFIVSDDDHPWNTYRNVEKYLMKAMGRGDYPVPRFP
ncbi:MAG TPA: NAD-dependent epimerase/dehydratase family protein, partial [Smithellaceae bacterium]|nr:NAD-dependent epimerase/dehydratase family protein [Smithellaceae bacterium]